MALARAFALEPEVLLLDEPFAALDQPTRETLLDELAGALGETGLTTVFVTHDRSEALRLGQRVAVIVGGRIRQVGATAEVFAAPADEDVASLVGAETIVAGKRVLVRLMASPACGGSTGRRQPGSRQPPGRRPGRATARGCDADEAGPGMLRACSARNHIHGTITRVTLLGYQARISIDCGFPLVALITKQSLEDMGLAAGQEITATFKAHAVHVIARAPSPADESSH